MKCSDFYCGIFLIGKMFLEVSPKDNISNLENQTGKMDDQIAALEARKAYLERQKNSLEANISELLAQCKTSG